jgi:hypothetical protein
VSYARRGIRAALGIHGRLPHEATRRVSAPPARIPAQCSRTGKRLWWPAGGASSLRQRASPEDRYDRGVKKPLTVPTAVKVPPGRPAPLGRASVGPVSLPPERHGLPVGTGPVVMDASGRPTSASRDGIGRAGKAYLRQPSSLVTRTTTARIELCKTDDGTTRGKRLESTDVGEQRRGGQCRRRRSTFRLHVSAAGVAAELKGGDEVGMATSPVAQRLVGWFIFGVIIALLPIVLSYHAQTDRDIDPGLTTLLGRGELLVISAVMTAGAVGELVGKEVGTRRVLLKLMAVGLVFSWWLMHLNIVSAVVSLVTTRRFARSKGLATITIRNASGRSVTLKVGRDNEQEKEAVLLDLVRDAVSEGSDAPAPGEADKH